MLIIIILMSIFIICCAVFLFAYSGFRKWRREHIRSLSVNLDRNYSSLSLGDYAIVPKQGGDICYANYFRNLHTDRLIMERYFSLLKKGGAVRLYIDTGDKAYFSNKKIAPYDCQYLHPVTLYEENVSPSAISSKKRLILNTLRFITTGFGKRKKHLQFVKADGCVPEILESNDDFIKMQQLCSKKQLALEIYCCR